MLFSISTERLLLRPAEMKDAAALLALNQFEEVVKYVHEVPWQTIEQAEEWIRKQYHEHYSANGFGRYVLELHSTGEVIGWCGLKLRPEYGHTDLGYRLHPAHWNKGYVTEAGEAMLLHGFYNLGYKRLVGWAQTKNTASVRVLQKLGGQQVKIWNHSPELELTEYEFIRPGANTNTPILFSSKRLDFREIRDSDTGVNFALNTDPQVVRWTGNSAFSSVKACADFYRTYGENYSLYGYARWMVTLRETDECIGWCGLKYVPERNCVDIGYRLFRRFWGKGLATEASIASIEHGFRHHHLNEIYGYVYAENAASIQVLKKSGLSYLDAETDETGELQRYVIKRS